jgi:hypothetical protein
MLDDLSISLPTPYLCVRTLVTRLTSVPAQQVPGNTAILVINPISMFL